MGANDTYVRMGSDRYYVQMVKRQQQPQQIKQTNVSENKRGTDDEAEGRQRTDVPGDNIQYFLLFDMASRACPSALQ